MRARIELALMLFSLLLLSGGSYGVADKDTEPYKYFREYVGLSDDQIAAIRHGKAFAKVLDSPTADQVFVFGAVHVDATPESYLKLASDVDTLRKLPNYLAIRKFSDPPQLSDLDGFSLEAQDIKDLKNCKPGHCDVQLPAETMEEFQKEVNWSAPDAVDQANRAARRMAFEALEQYIKGGNAALGTYRDKEHPAKVSETFQSILNRSKGLPAYLPDLDHYLLNYPTVQLSNVESQFYWEKVNFGLKPTFRIVQAIVYRGTRATEPAYAVAVKQLYSSHYFETAMDLTICVRDPESKSQRGIYLITLKGSQQAGLTGFKGTILRKIAVDKTRSSLEKTLVSIKQRLEAQAH